MIGSFFRRTTALAAIAAVVLSGVGCTRGVPADVVEATRPFTLQFWGVFDDSDAFEQTIARYRALRPHITVEYRKLRPEEYERELINALAEDKGPDIFMVHNTQVAEYQSKLLPLPASLTLPVREQQGTIQKQVVTVLRQVPSLSIRQLQSQFVDVVAEDVVLPREETTTGGGRQTVNRIYGLPLSVDTLALYFNKTLLNQAGIPEAPRSWGEVQAAARNKRLTVYDASQRITQSAIAMGTAGNVERAVDVLQLLMMQNRTTMADDEGTVSFNRRPASAVGELNPGAEASVFYTDFANPVKEVYTWNDTMPSSLEAFAGGRTAMFLGYSYHLATIRARAPKLEVGIAPIPQIGDEINFANYWVNGVSTKSEHADEAWDFVQFMAAQDQAKTYLDATKRPTALRALVGAQREDLDIGVFAAQALTAKSWYKGHDAAAMETAFKDLIRDVLANPSNPQQWVEIAAQKVAQTYSF
ncbi:extracellular solute-binding protein [Patescibacteria group bacterium]|nr:MAG: extracellular solute-binding protein [Patescibacteria group bacterium]